MKKSPRRPGARGGIVRTTLTAANPQGGTPHRRASSCAWRSGSRRAKVATQAIPTVGRAPETEPSRFTPEETPMIEQSMTEQVVAAAYAADDALDDETD